MSLYLNVPFSEKDKARSLGARWNPRVKKWYADVGRDKYVNFSKWILKEGYDAKIAIEYIFLIEGEQRCWKCGNMTRVIGLGIGEYVHIFGEDDAIQYEIVEDYVETGEELHLAWVDREEDIPPKLLNFMKENYSVKTGYSKTSGGKCFANHCDNFGAIQGL